MSAAEDSIAAAIAAKKKANALAPEMAGFTAAKAPAGDEDNKEDPKPKFNLKVYSPYKVYFNEAAYSVSASNLTGPFDVLPGHKNFLSLLKPCTLKIENPRGQESIKINRGIMHVKKEEVLVFLDI